MGRSNPLCDLDQCGMWADIVDVITCPYLVTVGGVSLVRGVILHSLIDLRYRLTTMLTLICDRVILRQFQFDSVEI